MRIIRCTALRSLLAFVLLAAGCTYWGRRSVDQPTAVDTHAPVWIWSGNDAMKWYAVFITRDSVSGIPYGQFEYCRTCRLTIPLTGVDSMKVASRTLLQKVTETAGIVFVTVVVLLGDSGR